MEEPNVFSNPNCLFSGPKPKVAVQGDVVVLAINFRITLGEGAVALSDSIHSLFNKGHAKILVDLADCTYIDSAGLAALVLASEYVTTHGGQLKLLGLTLDAINLLQIAKLYNAFKIFKDRDEALRSFD